MSKQLFAMANGQRYDLKSWEINYTAIGRKFTLVFNGHRDDLDYLGKAIASKQDGYRVASIPAITSDFKKQFFDGPPLICRSPKLSSNGEGKLATLTVTAEAGLQNGDGTNSWNWPNEVDMDDSKAFAANAGNRLPSNTTVRVVYEPNDVSLGYGMPFRAGKKWDLTVAAGSLPSDVASTLSGPGGFASPTSLTLLEIIHFWETAAIEQQARGPIQTWLLSNASTKEYMTRYLRGQTSYRFFVPHVTVTRRYRSEPDTSVLPQPGQVAEFNKFGGPPQWTRAPYKINDVVLKYYCSGPQVDFNGECWTMEMQFSGFADYDTALYSAT